MLPNIVEVAYKYQLTVHTKSMKNEEVLCKCPFCLEDDKPGKKRRYYLSLNSKDQVFKCWFCGERGGVFRFIALLEGVPEEEVRSRYRKRKVVHPAQRLTRRQLLLFSGFEKLPDWEAMRKRDRSYYRRTLDHLWKQWNLFLEAERREAFFLLMLGIRYGKYQEYVGLIRQREKEIEASLLTEVLNLYSCASRPLWTEKIESKLNAYTPVRPEPQMAGMGMEE